MAPKSPSKHRNRLQTRLNEESRRQRRRVLSHVHFSDSDAGVLKRPRAVQPPRDPRDSIIASHDAEIEVGDAMPPALTNLVASQWAFTSFATNVDFVLGDDYAYDVSYLAHLGGLVPFTGAPSRADDSADAVAELQDLLRSGGVTKVVLDRAAELVALIRGLGGGVDRVVASDDGDVSLYMLSDERLPGGASARYATVIVGEDGDVATSIADRGISDYRVCDMLDAEQSVDSEGVRVTVLALIRFAA